MNAAAVSRVIRDYEAVWAERDPARRAALIAASLIEDATIVGPGYRLCGHAAIADEAARFQRTEPGHRACIAGAIDAHGDWARFAVKIEDAAGVTRAEGLDVVEFARDGRIARVITFWNATPAGGVRGAEASGGRDATIEVFDTLPDDETKIVDEGLGRAIATFGPIAAVRRLGCFARVGGVVIGGAVGRTWGECCELQQLWVDDTYRGRGLGTRLVRSFEARARERGCRTYYLDTFSFQAPIFYRGLGYETALAIDGYAPGVVRHTMMRRD